VIDSPIVGFLRRRVMKPKRGMLRANGLLGAAESKSLTRDSVAFAANVRATELQKRFEGGRKIIALQIGNAEFPFHIQIADGR
jgi:hypothetical protein